MLDTIPYVVTVLGLTAVFVSVVRAKWPTPPPIDESARAMAERAINELATARDELSKLRADKDREIGEIHTQVGKHERSIVNIGHQLNDTVARVTAETSKLSMQLSQQRPRGM